MKRWLLGAAACAVMAQGPALTFEQCMARLKAPAELLAAEAFLAQRDRELVGTSAFLREGPSLGVDLGRRRGGVSATDRGLSLDLPLFLRPDLRAGLARALEQAGPMVREAAALEGKHRLRSAYLNAWLAQALVALREEDARTVQAWHAAAQARVEAGADAPFQADLVAGERLKADQDLWEARRVRQESWAMLAALADLPAAPEALGEPASVAPPAGDLEARFRVGLLRRALSSRLQAEEAAVRLRLAVDTSRFSLRTGYATEGEDRIAKVGLALRLPRRGEGAAARVSAEAELATARREAEQALAALEGRFRSAREALGPAAGALDVQGALTAIGLRLTEGKERPSEALPIRRQLLEAQVARLRRTHALALVASDLETLTR